MVFNLSLFDFTANDVSRSSEPFITSNRAFAERFDDLRKGKKRDMLVANDEDLEMSNGPETEMLVHPQASSETALNGDDTSPEPAIKRPVSSSSTPSEVESVPAFVKKRKQELAVKESTDNEFQEVVRKTYLIREGKRFYAMSIEYIVIYRILLKYLTVLFIYKDCNSHIIPTSRINFNKA